MCLLSVCLSSTAHSTFTIFLRMLFMTVARSPSGGVTIRDELPVLWMKCAHNRMAKNRRRKKAYRPTQNDSTRI